MNNQSQNKPKQQITHNNLMTYIISLRLNKSAICLLAIIWNLGFPCLPARQGICDLHSLSNQVYASDSKEEEALFVAKRAFEDGFYEVSLELLDRFMKNYPASLKLSEASLLAGQCYFHQNRFLDALTKFEELVNQPNAKNIKDAVLYWIAEVHFKGNDYTKAIGYYKKVIDDFPKSAYAVSAYYSLGWCFFQVGNLNDALKYFKIVEEKFPREPQAQDSAYKAIECLYSLKDYKGLKDKVKSYLSSYSDDTNHKPYLYFYLAEADYYLNNFSEAIDWYSKVITATADDKIKAFSKLGMGWAYLKLKQYQQAQNSFLEIKTDSLEKRSQDILLLGRAILAFETVKLSDAKNMYNELLNVTSDPVVLIQAYLGKADTLYNLTEYKEAIRIYKEGVDKVAKDSSIPQEIIDKLHYGLAWSYLKEGDFKEAIEEFRKLVTHTEDKIIKVSILCQIGDTYQDSGDYTKAQETYDSILRDYPDSFYGDYVQYQLGLTFLKASNYDGAILSFLSVRRNFPDSKLLDDAVYALGLAYFQRQDYNLSKETFEGFINEFKNSNLRSQAMYLLGTSFYNLGKFAEAIEVFKNIIRTYSQDIELIQKAEYEAADCYYQMGNEKEAMERFKILRSKYPDSNLTAEVMWWLGEYYYRRNELNLSRRYFSSLIQDFPKSNLLADAYYALGSISAEESSYSEAINNFKKIIEFGRSDIAGQAAVAIGDIYVKQEKFDLALSTYKDVVQQYNNLAHLIYSKIADTYLKINNYEQAIDFYRKSLEIVPLKETSQMQFKIAEVLQAQGKTQEAIEEYLKVSYLYSENNNLSVKAFLRVAAIYEDKEDYKAAINFYKKVVSLNVEESKYAQERIDWITTHKK